MVGHPHIKKEMMEVCAETCRRNQLKDAYIRLVVSRGVGDLGLDPRNCKKTTIVCIADQIALYPEEFYKKGLKAATAATRKNYGEVLPPQVKTCNYLPNIMAKIESLVAGAQECFCMSREGYLTEGSGDNVFLVKKGVVKTPHPATGILIGVTRNAIIELAKKLGYPVEETFLTRYDVYTADEAFVTGTAAEMVAVVEVDGRKIGDGKPGPVTEKAQRGISQTGTLGRISHIQVNRRRLKQARLPAGWPCLFGERGDGFGLQYISNKSWVH